MQNLNNLIDPANGWFLLEAFEINDMGQIVGQGINPYGEEHAFLLTPVPVICPISLVQSL
jgi:probable HAF family extracellular repeat protein